MNQVSSLFAYLKMAIPFPLKFHNFQKKVSFTKKWSIMRLNLNDLIRSFWKENKDQREKAWQD